MTDLLYESSPEIRAFAVTLSGAILAIILFLAEIGRFHAAGQVTTVCKHSQQI